MKRQPLAYGLALIGLAGGWPSQAGAEETLTDAERARVLARISPVIPSRPSLALSAGDTAFVEGRLVVPTARVRRDWTRYEGVMVNPQRAGSPTIPRGVDALQFVPRGPETEVIFVYTVVIPAKARRGGRIAARFELRERAGLGNTIARKKVRHQVRVTPPRPSRVDLAADFRGHRYFLSRARQRMAALEKAGLRQLSIQDGPPPKGTRRLNAAGLQQLALFEKERRRAWVAHRHLVAAANARNPKVARWGRAFLKNLAKPSEQWSGVPDLTLVEKPKLEDSEEKRGGRLEPVAEYRS
ncbi:MAG: hypothetical protein AAFZ18_02170, partial [Myxococcota bacterium]